MPSPATATTPALLLVNKPAGCTSFDVIRDLKRRLNRRDLGHGGTLDGFATGLLPVFAGEGLKLARFFLEPYPMLATCWKTYRAVVRLGVATDTLDPTGAVTVEKPVPYLTDDLIAQAAALFHGRTYEQIPPAYSAKKIEGERASDLMRQGETPELQPATVTLRCLEARAISATELELHIICSKGTYVRSLARDLAVALGTVAHVTRLERIATGPLSVADASPPEAFPAEAAAAASLGLKDACRLLLPVVAITAAEATSLRLGQTAPALSRVAAEAPLGPCVLELGGEPVGLAESMGADAPARFLRAFTPA